jgi:hypothetical protein
MKILRTAIALSALGLFAGCVAYPEYAVAPAPYYGQAYYPPPVYYGPSVGIGIYGGWHGGHHHGGPHRHG